MQHPPEIAFDSAPDFLKLPVNMYLGEASAVTVNSKGDIFVFSRGGSSVGPAAYPHQTVLEQAEPPVGPLAGLWLPPLCPARALVVRQLDQVPRRVSHRRRRLHPAAIAAGPTGR